MNQARRDPGALILIAVGVLWLIAQSGFVPGAVASGLGFYWPLLVIGLGFDLLGWNRPWHIPYTALAAVVVLVGVAVLPSPMGAGTATEFREPVAGTTAATVRLDLGDAASEVRAVGDSGSLFTGHTTGWRHAAVEVTHANPARIRVSPEGGGRAPALSFRPNRWRFGLATAVPLDLAVAVGSGRTDLDLRGVQLTALTLRGGSGALRAILPDADARYRASFEGGSGGSTIRVAPGAALALDLVTGSGRTSVTFGDLGSARVTLRAGSGPVTLDVPQGAAVRLTVDSDGSGPLRLARSLRRVSGHGETGSWASGSGNGTPAVDITVEHAGSGPITVR